jgi:hypothetical protein
LVNTGQSLVRHWSIIGWLKLALVGLGYTSRFVL